MNFYPHHIKDFNNSTRHLTRVERSVYRDAIELYYDSECMLCNDFDRLARKLLCDSNEEKSALRDVLNEFFTLTDEGYYHERCDEEITKYRANISAKAKAGIASAAKRKQKSTDVQQKSTRVHNQEPITKNQEPIISNTKGSRLSKDWILTDEYIAEANKINSALSNEQIKNIAAGFKDFWISVAGAKGVKLDWLATWRNWIRNQKDLPKEQGKPDWLKGAI